MRSLPGALLEVELGYEEPGYDKTFEVLASEGFAAPRSARGGRTVLSATAPEATARLRCSEAGDLLCLPRAAGSWPAREAMRWNGKAPAADALHVLWPQPNDPRLNAALLAAPELESLPPGSFAIWREGGGAVAFDPAHLDPERAAELRALGYLGSE